MSAENGYRTRQRAAILQYFKSHPHAHLTAEELCDALRANGISVGAEVHFRTPDFIGFGFVTEVREITEE